MNITALLCTMSSMPDKRKASSSASGTSPYAKRNRPSYVVAGGDRDGDGSQAYGQPRNNSIYGQKSAFPGLDDSVGDELFYGPAEDGIEYLRMVRSEANSLPSFFATKQPETIATTAAAAEAATTTVVGPPDQQTLPDKKQNLNEHPNDHKKGIYIDGVYVGPPVPDTTTGYVNNTKAAAEQEGDTFTSPQEIYYNLLHHRFLLLRSTLKCAPPASAIAALDDFHPISLPRGSIPARKEWRRLLLSVDPQMVQLASMDMSSVLNVLGVTARLMSENVRSGDVAKVRRFGAWAWGLLGKCREVGQLGTEEVGEIRDLGKRAARILAKMREDDKRSREHSNKLTAVSDMEESLDRDEGYDQDREKQRGNENECDYRNDDDDVLGSGGGHVAETGLPDHEMPNAKPEQTSDEALDAAKVRLQEKLQHTDISEQETGGISENKGSQELGPERNLEQAANAADVNEQARAMLDMIITIVGEYYGQRDLLAAREIWDEKVQV